MRKNKVLLVEDDSTLRFIVEDSLVREGFDVTSAADGDAGLKRFREVSPDIVVADVMMPRMDGFEMLRRMRAEVPEVPMLFLTARTSIDDVVKGFELGANDYLRKPFQIIELVVRIRALLGRRPGNRVENSTTEIGDCKLDFASQKLMIGEKTVDLSHIEVLILDELFRHPNQVVEARCLMIRIWQNDDYNNLNRLHGFIYKLRKYLAASTVLELINARGVGYKLAVKESD